VSPRGASRLAWSLFAVAVALVIPASVLSLLIDNVPGYEDRLESAVDLGVGLALLAFPLVGALIVSRDPRNSIGWLFCAAGVPFALAGLAHSWGAYALFERPGALPAGEVAAWLSTWLFVPPLFAVPALLFLLFPDGRPPSPRWRPVVWAVGIAVALTAAGSALTPGRLTEQPFRGIENPVGLEGGRTVLEMVAIAGFITLFFTVLIGAAAIVVRFRRAAGEERVQLKWFAFAGAVFAFACVLNVAPISPLPSDTWGHAVVLLAFAGIPVAAGVAILRYRLYDIDVVINRTLVYGALTATLAGAYLGGVLLLQLALSPLTEQSDLAVAGSTLAVAALFRPARQRIQQLVDRRFYRHRYDAQVTLEQFGGRLRDQVHIEALAGELRGVVTETMQPAHLSLWLRPPAVHR
jgi:hypothetical protein